MVESRKLTTKEKFSNIYDINKYFILLITLRCRIHENYKCFCGVYSPNNIPYRNAYTRVNANTAVQGTALIIINVRCYSAYGYPCSKNGSNCFKSTWGITSMHSFVYIYTSYIHILYIRCIYKYTLVLRFEYMPHKRYIVEW